MKFNINHSNTVDLQTRPQTIACAGYLLIQISQSTLIIKSPSPWKLKKKFFLRTSIFANQKKIFTYTNFQKLSKNILLLVHIFCKNDKHDTKISRFKVLNNEGIYPFGIWRLTKVYRFLLEIFIILSSEFTFNIKTIAATLLYTWSKL